MRNLVLIILSLLLIQLSSSAQTSNMGYFRKAEQLYGQKEYYAAIQYYERFLGVDRRPHPRAQPFVIEKKVKGQTNMSPRQQAVYHLSIAYIQQHDFIKAEKWAKQATTFPRQAFPESQYWYAKTLLANAKYDTAMDAFLTFEKEYTAMGPILNDADRQVDNLRFIQSELKKRIRPPFTLTRQSNNGYTSAYALTVRKDDTLVFTGIHRTAPKEKKGDSAYINDLYQTVSGVTASIPGFANSIPGFTNSIPGFANSVPGPANSVPSPAGSVSTQDPAADSNILASSSLITTPMDKDDAHNGLATFSPDGSRMFFTHWTRVKGVTRAAIWSRQHSDTGWSAPTILPDPINVEGYNSTQPFITSDGKFLIFATDRPGGLGGYDLWYADLDSNFKALFASDLGAKINTPGDEASPFYHQKSHTLIFASNGRVGMGGFDIYYASGYFNLSNWEQPHNPGVPVNSSKDDLYFTSTDEDNCWNTGWLSSDRHSGCCLALYTVRQNNAQYISGTILDCASQKPLRNVQLLIDDGHHDGHHEGQLLARLQTDSLGNYGVRLTNTSRYHISAQKDGYLLSDTLYIVQMQTDNDTIMNETICMRLVPPPSPEKELKELNRRSSVLGNFPYKKSALPPSAYQSLDSLISLMQRNPTIKIQVEGYTDGIGGEKYNIRLAQSRVNACIRYLVKKGIDPGRLTGKSFGKCCPIAPDTIDGKDNPAGREMNRRVEYKLVQ